MEAAAQVVELNWSLDLFGGRADVQADCRRPFLSAYVCGSRHHVFGHGSSAPITSVSRNLHAAFFGTLRRGVPISRFGMSVEVVCTYWPLLLGNVLEWYEFLCWQGQLKKSCGGAASFCRSCLPCRHMGALPGLLSSAFSSPTSSSTSSMIQRFRPGAQMVFGTSVQF